MAHIGYSRIITKSIAALGGNIRKIGRKTPTYYLRRFPEAGPESLRPRALALAPQGNGPVVYEFTHDCVCQMSDAVIICNQKSHERCKSILKRSTPFFAIIWSPRKDCQGRFIQEVQDIVYHIHRRDRF